MFSKITWLKFWRPRFCQVVTQQNMNYLSFKDFINNNKLKKEATTNIKIEQFLLEFHFRPKVYTRDGPFTSFAGIVNFHLEKHIGFYFLMSFF